MSGLAIYTDPWQTARDDSFVECEREQYDIEVVRSRLRRYKDNHALAIKMWLDRFSANPTPTGSPPPQQRSFSPGPRRPNLLGHGAAPRPGFSPRSSSLNVSGKFNWSTTSLNSARLPNGSGLKQQITPPADSTDPLKVLEDIVGKPLHASDGEHEILQNGARLERPAELVEDIQFSGLGLQDFVQREENEDVSVLLTETTQSAEECEYVCSSSAKVPLY